jgi:hypothetical protein
VCGEVVERLLDGLPGAQGADVLDEQRSIERVRMVEVLLRAFLERQAGQVAVVAVLLEDDDAQRRQRGDDAAGDGGLAGAGPAADADDQRAGGLRGLWFGVQEFLEVCRGP